MKAIFVGDSDRRLSQSPKAFRNVPDLAEIRRTLEPLPDVLTVFEQSFWDEIHGWPYSVSALSRKPKPEFSNSTNAMIAFALVAATGGLRRGVLLPLTRPVEISGSFDEKRRGALRTLVATALDTLAGKMNSEPSAVQLESRTFGINDPFTITWLVEVHNAISRRPGTSAFRGKGEQLKALAGNVFGRVVVATAVKPTRATSISLSLFAGERFERPDSPSLRQEVISSAISNAAGRSVLSQLGPSLLRFSIVDRNSDRQALAAAGLDFLINWGDQWRAPAEAYLAYLASLFASAEGSAERSFEKSATGFVAGWFAARSSAALAHFELHDNMVRVDALTMQSHVLGEHAFKLPPKWEQVLAATRAKVVERSLVVPHRVGEAAVRLSGVDGDMSLDEVAKSMSGEAAAANRMLVALAKHMGAQEQVEPSPELILRLASYLHLAQCQHAYYLLPPSLVFNKIPDVRVELPRRFEAGNLHVTTKQPLDPRVAIELLAWQSSI